MRHCSEHHRSEKQKLPLFHCSLLPGMFLCSTSRGTSQAQAPGQENSCSKAWSKDKFGTSGWKWKVHSQFLAAVCSQRAWGTPLTCFCKANYSGSYLTLHHTAEKLQEDHTSRCCASSFFEETGKWRWFEAYTLETTNTLDTVSVRYFPGVSCLPLFCFSYPSPSQKIVLFYRQALQITSYCYDFITILNWFIGFCLKLLCRATDSTTQ